jgi:hypothetical protein
MLNTSSGVARSVRLPDVTTTHWECLQKLVATLNKEMAVVRGWTPITSFTVRDQTEKKVGAASEIICQIQPTGWLGLSMIIARSQNLGYGRWQTIACSIMAEQINCNRVFSCNDVAGGTIFFR